MNDRKIRRHPSKCLFLSYIQSFSVSRGVNAQITGKDVLSRRNMKYRRKDCYKLHPLALNLIVSLLALPFKETIEVASFGERRKHLELRI